MKTIIELANQIYDDLLKLHKLTCVVSDEVITDDDEFDRLKHVISFDKALKCITEIIIWEESKNE